MIAINIHGVDQVTVRDCTRFVTVEFATPNLDTVTLFFPNHTAVWKMMANLARATNSALGREIVKQGEVDLPSR